MFHSMCSKRGKYCLGSASNMTTRHQGPLKIDQILISCLLPWCPQTAPRWRHYYGIVEAAHYPEISVSAPSSNEIKKNGGQNCEKYKFNFLAFFFVHCIFWSITNYIFYMTCHIMFHWLFSCCCIPHILHAYLVLRWIYFDLCSPIRHKAEHVWKWMWCKCNTHILKRGIFWKCNDEYMKHWILTSI